MNPRPAPKVSIKPGQAQFAQSQFLSAVTFTSSPAENYCVVN